MAEKIEAGGLLIDEGIYNLIKDEIAPGTGIEPEQFFTSLAEIVRDLAPKNKALLEKRAELETQVNDYFAKGEPFDNNAYTSFLEDIGYIVPEGDDFTVSTQNVDPEIAEIAGPQLVVPADNARFSLSAANARWESMFNAAYGKPGNTNIIDEDDGKEFLPGAYNSKRGEAVIAWTLGQLDEIFPLSNGNYSDATQFAIQDGNLTATLENGSESSLQNNEQCVGYAGEPADPSAIVLKNNGLHVIIEIDRSDKNVGSTQKAGIKDIIFESAITTIQDFEDAAVMADAEHIITNYRNWAGLMKGDLSEPVDKEPGGVRKLAEDKIFTAPDGSELRLPGRSLMFNRHMGSHITTSAVTTAEGQEIPQAFLDAMVSALAAKHDLAKDASAPIRNSRTGSLYIVKPKMHGPEEVAATVELFARVEQALNIPATTLKIGIMDEEQRTSVNLKECVRAAQDRVVFINTGFLDRTGDLIHTAMQAGPYETKLNMNKADWLQAYERNNVQVGLAAGLNKTGQIGKGMWAQNRNMKGLIDTKYIHPQAGADTAWVPSNHAAAIHALHYHKNSVQQIQQQLLDAGNAPINKADILNIPLLQREMEEGKKAELLDSYTQSILGYVSRWVTMGIGCSSIPDHTNTFLMEDKATLRIGSQLLANWIEHNIVSWDEVETAFQKMAAVVDEQNAGQEGYIPMADDFDASPAFQASLEIVKEGINSPNGYTDNLLHTWRRNAKATLKKTLASAA